MHACMHGCTSGSEHTVFSATLYTPTRDTDALLRIRCIISPSLFEVSKTLDTRDVSSLHRERGFLICGFSALLRNTSPPKLTLYTNYSCYPCYVDFMKKTLSRTPPQ